MDALAADLLPSLPLRTLSVVPILVNGGVAILPALAVGLGSALAMLLRPRDLIAACRRRPVVPLLLVAGGAALWFGVSWAFAGAAKPPPRGGTPVATGAAPTRRDWNQVALDILRRERAGTMATTPNEQGKDLVLGRDFGRCGYDGGPSPVGLSLLWEFRPEGTMFLSSPAVASVETSPGKTAVRVFGASCLLDVVKVGSVVCLDAETGKLVWQTDAVNDVPLKPFFSSPALTQDRKSLLIGQGLHDDANCSLLCLDAATGAVRWQVPTPLHIESSPAVRGDLVVAGAGAIEGSDHKPRGDGGFVLAVRISDGKELWRHPVADPESSPAIGDDGTVYVGSGFNGNAVVALRSETDEELKAKGLARELWRTPLPHPATGAITIARDQVIVGAGNGDYVYANPNPEGIVVALHPGSGAIRWKVKLGDAVLGAVAHRDGKLICPVRNGEVVALDASDGRELWRQRVSGAAPVLAGPAFTGRHVYAVSKDGTLSVLDAADGKRIGKNEYLNDEARPGAEGLTLSSPAVFGGRVFVGSETGGLRCYAGSAVGSQQ